MVSEKVQLVNHHYTLPSLLAHNLVNKGLDHLSVTTEKKEVNQVLNSSEFSSLQKSRFMASRTYFVLTPTPQSLAPVLSFLTP